MLMMTSGATAHAASNCSPGNIYEIQSSDSPFIIHTDDMDRGILAEPGDRVIVLEDAGVFNFGSVRPWKKTTSVLWLAKAGENPELYYAPLNALIKGESAQKLATGLGCVSGQ